MKVRTIARLCQIMRSVALHGSWNEPFEHFRKLLINHPVWILRVPHARSSKLTRTASTFLTLPIWANCWHVQTMQKRNFLFELIKLNHEQYNKAHHQQETQNLQTLPTRATKGAIAILYKHASNCRHLPNLVPFASSLQLFDNLLLTSCRPYANQAIWPSCLDTTLQDIQYVSYFVLDLF